MAQDREEDFKDRDEELLRANRAAPEGDLRAFEQLVQMHQKRILADCRYLTGCDNDSEDLAQEVFVKAFFGLRGFEGRSTFRHWLQRIKVHHCLNHLKKREGKAAVGIDEEAAGNFEQLRIEPAAERNLELTQERKRISGILNSMPATLRIPLVMRDMDELSYEEIAVSLGVGLSAVKMRIKRAREQFRNLYERDKPAGGES
jgi:RNA polymerase sigma-70 factor (ECF subfamily)